MTRRANEKRFGRRLRRDYSGVPLEAKTVLTQRDIDGEWGNTGPKFVDYHVEPIAVEERELRPVLVPPTHITRRKAS